MSSITFEPSSSCQMSSMLDSNKGNTCAASSAANTSMIMQYSNSGAIFTPQQGQHNISQMIYNTNHMACSTGESSTTSSVSSSHTRLQQFDTSDLSTNYNPNLSNDQYIKSDELEELEPMTRDRCNTWPMRRPVIEPQTSPLIHEQIPEEDSVYGSEEHLTESATPQQTQQFTSSTITFNNNQPIICEEENDQFLEDLSPGDGETTPPSGTKKSATRRNAWGNMSYADLITQAILSSPEQRLTLSQIYSWMVENVPYFSNKGDSNSSAGWKMEDPHIEVDKEGDDEPSEFRSRSKTWPSKANMVEITYSSSGIDSASGSITHLPSITEFNPTNSSWSPNSSENYTDPYVISGDSPFYSSMGTHDNGSNQSLEKDLSVIGPEKPKRTRRRNTDSAPAKKENPWGVDSYADLIIKALKCAPDERLRLNEIYQWFVENVPYFQNRASPEQSAGWKNSIRHNLSLHNRFMRIQNEGAGKSSWWTLNPDAKSGRNPRRRAATMDTSTKAAIKRRGARKRVEVGSVRGSTQGLVDSVTGSQLSMTSQDLYNDGGEDSLGANYERFRARTQSNISMPGKSSPNYEDYEYPPWVNANNGTTSLGSQLGPITSNVNEIMDSTAQMRLDNTDSVISEFCPTGTSLKDVLQQRQSPLQMTIQTLKKEEIKQEPIAMQQPPSYQEVIQTQGQMRPAMMHSQIMQPKLMSTNSSQQPQFYQTSVYNVPQSQMVNQQPHWLQMPHHSQQIVYNQPQTSFGQQQVPNMMMTNMRGQMGQPLPPINDLSQTDLPNDLVGLSNLDSRFMDTDIESIMRTL